ncbi:hypothetical protein HBB16_01005 [Pseudonocardia sp. MCCB 268]|nr:hypothetical protein [Pseudonocardia cytotoxica]
MTRLRGADLAVPARLARTGLQAYLQLGRAPPPASRCCQWFWRGGRDRRRTSSRPPGAAGSPVPPMR